MWGKKSEALNIVNLRKAATSARNELNIQPFTGKIVIELAIYADESEIESMGDLDNFVTGICDGLQAADPRAKISEVIMQECEPYKPILFLSDSKVYEIWAQKIPTIDREKYYEVTVSQI